MKRTSSILLYGVIISIFLISPFCNASRLNPETGRQVNHLWTPDLQGENGDTVVALISMQNDDVVVDTLSLELGYDTDMLTYTGCVPGALDPGWDVFDCSESPTGLLTMNASVSSGNIPAGSMGVLIEVSFLVICSLELPSSLDLDNFGGDIAAFTHEDGLFTCTEYPCIRHGDVNFSDVVTAEDAQLAFLITLVLYPPTYPEYCAADCNGNGTVTAGDAQTIFLAALLLDSCVDPIPSTTPTHTPTVPTPTPTKSPLPPTATSSAMPNTRTPTPSNTPTPTSSTATPTYSAVPETATPTSSAVPDTATPTYSAVPNTATPTYSAVPNTSTPTVPSATPSSTAIPDTPTPSATNIPDTPTPSPTEIPDTPTPTSTTIPDTPTPTNSPIPQPTYTPTRTATPPAPTPTRTPSALPYYKR